MAIFSLFSDRSRAASGDAALVSTAQASGNTRSEPVFAPRRAGVSLLARGNAPANTRLANVLGAQPPQFARGREVAALLLWTFAVFLLLALASYEGDPAAVATQAAAGAEPGAPGAVVVAITGANWVGPVGEHAARAFATLIGGVAWLVPLEAFLLGIPFVRGRKSHATPTRIAGDLLMVVIATALIQVGGPGKMLFGRHPAGGTVGELFGELARSLFSTAGSFLVGFALLGLILIGRATFSFITLVRWVAHLGSFSVTRTAQSARAVRAAWKKARDLENVSRAERANENTLIVRGRPSEDLATILVPDHDDDDRDEAYRAFLEHDDEGESERHAFAEPLATPARARLVTAAATEPFAEESPLVVVASDTKKPVRRKKIGDEITLGAEPKKALNPRKKKISQEEEEAESVAQALIAAAAEPGGSTAGLIDNSDTPLDAVTVTTTLDEVVPRSEPLTRERKREHSPQNITIVDTSAALEKDALSKVELKKVEKNEKRKAGTAFTLPSLSMLTPGKPEIGPMFDEEKLRRNAELLVKTLADYKITGKVEEILPGPVVTTYEVSPVAGTKVSKVSALADDLALALAKKVRIVAPIPGKNRIGFELPNDKRLPVIFRDLVEDRRFQTLDVPLPVVLGRDIVGNPVYADLASMPHAIVAGATGAGKSVGLNVMLTSLLYRRTPDELRMLMIDPKVVELAPYDRIPHMLLPVVTDMKQASNALKWAVDEMERRYQLFADAGTKNIGTYNGWVRRVLAGEIRNPLGKAIVGRDHNNLPETLSVSFDDPEGEQLLPEVLPMIVIVVDEFADLMMQQGKEVEVSVARLAQKARAAGMHVILATQRPSVDVITGMIKANFPTRIAYRVAQKIDSRTILDEQGAEHLLGRGDMLIKLNGTNETKRVQCPWVSEEEVQAVTDFLRAQGEPVYDDNILKPRDDDAAAEADDGETDAMYDDAVRIVAETRRCSTSWLQRKLQLGYNRAARIVETMEKRGLVGPSNGAKDREVLISQL